MEEGPDIDLFIPIDNRTLNLYIEDMPKFIDNRIQLLDVRSILVRFSTAEDNYFCTVHFLRNIDLKSAIMNLVFEYKNHHIKIRKSDYSVDMFIAK